MVFTILLSDIGPHLERFCVLEQHDSAGDGSSGFIEHGSFDRTGSWAAAGLILHTRLDLRK